MNDAQHILEWARAKKLDIVFNMLRFTDAMLHNGELKDKIGFGAREEDFMRKFFLDRVQEESVLSGQAFLYLHYADMIANGYKRTMPCPFQRQGLLLNPNGDLFYCENSQKIGNTLDTPAADLYFGVENLAHRETLKRDTCPTCLSPCQVNVARHEAGRAVRELPAPRLPGQARSVPASRHPADSGAMTAASLIRRCASASARSSGSQWRSASRPGFVWQADLTAMRGGVRAHVLGVHRRRLPAGPLRPAADGLALDRPARCPRRPSARPSGRCFARSLSARFVGTFLVQTVGSDAFRTWSLARDGVPAVRSRSPRC